MTNYHQIGDNIKALHIKIPPIYKNGAQVAGFGQQLFYVLVLLKLNNFEKTLLLNSNFVIILKQTFFGRSTAQGGRRQNL